MPSPPTASTSTYTFRGFFDSVQLLDGVRNEGNRVNTQLTNIERVEVLKGPSSALYGGAALGATVNLIRKKPSAAPAYDFSASAGSWNTGRAAFGATGRLGSDAALYRLDIGGETKEGYRHNDTTRFTVTPSLQWRFGGNNQVNAYYTFNRDRFGGDAGLPLTNFDFGVPIEDNVPNVPRDRNYRTPQDDATSVDNNLQVAYARQFSDSLGFRDTLSYRHFNDKYFLSEEIYFVPPSTIDRYYLYFNHHRRPLMNIAELTGHFAKGIEQNLVIGWESQRYKSSTLLPDEDFFQAASIDAFNPVETQGPSVLTPVTHANVFTNTTNAFYVQDHLTLGPRVKLLLGGRYDIYRRESHVDPIDERRPDDRRRSPSATPRRSRRGSGWSTSRRRQVDLYGSFANSFKPLTLAQPDGSSLDPETGSQFEFGQRFHIVGDRLQLNTVGLPDSSPERGVPPAGQRLRAGGRGPVARLRGGPRDLVELAVADQHVVRLHRCRVPRLRGVGRRQSARQHAGVRAAPHVQRLDRLRLAERVRRQRRRPVFRPHLRRQRQHVRGRTATVWPTSACGIGAARWNTSSTSTTSPTRSTSSPHLDFLQAYPGDPVNVLATVRVHLK